MAKLKRVNKDSTIKEAILDIDERLIMLEIKSKKRRYRRPSFLTRIYRAFFPRRRFYR